MQRRVSWFIFILVLPIVIFAVGARQFTQAQAFHFPMSDSIIINEWSQGASGSKEWVELLVIADALDLSGWDLGDSSPGDLTFETHSLWQNLPAGTRIVIYNGNDRDTVLPADDIDPADCTLIVAHNSEYFSGGWPAFSNSNAADNPHLRDAADNTAHDFSIAPGSIHPGSQKRVGYMGDTAVDVSQAAKWVIDEASNASPSMGNGGANSVWAANLCSPGSSSGVDLAISKTGPTTAVPDSTISYNISLQNVGDQAAVNIVLTDLLPDGLTYVPDSGPFTQTEPGVLVWEAASLEAGTSTMLEFSAMIGSQVAGSVQNEVSVTSDSTESNLANNTDTAATAVTSNIPAEIIIDAVLYDGQDSNDSDEAVALRNVGTTAVDIGEWQLSDGGSSATIPAGTILPPGSLQWIARDADAFQRQFGYAPDVVLESWPGFANIGDEVVLLDNEDEIVDVLVYGTGDSSQIGWQGLALQPYTVSSNFSQEGQVLYRMRDQVTGLPIVDTDQAVDWAQATDDIINGRKVRYPGWDLDAYFHTAKITETAVLTIAIAPDNAFETVAAQINSAQNSLQIASLTFENVGIADALLNALDRGVAVTVLLEGGPSGGLPDSEKYICRELETAGGQCYFMINEPDERIFDRYRFMHAKYIIVDSERVVISSENMSPNSMPNDDKSDGTWGRRGVVLMTDAPGVVAHLQALFAHDADAANHVDIFRWQADHPTYGNPSPGYVPSSDSGGITYTVRYPQPTVLTGQFGFEIVQSPENSLRSEDSLLGLVKRARQGDTVLVQQLSERPYWGATDSNPITDPSPRVEAYIDAARRGATVKLMLDSLFNDTNSPVSNQATCEYVNGIGRSEGLRLRCDLGNPAGLGIHNKMVLVNLNGHGFVHVGSLNGSEMSSKGNRELALQIQSDEAYALLSEMFLHDYPLDVFLPVVFNKFEGPATHVLISEVLYDSYGPDEAEFIELVNPTNKAIDISGFGLGDAVAHTDFEDVRRFPAGTVLPPRAVIVVATTASAFYVEYGFLPDFEIVDTETAVADLIDDPTWGDTDAILQLGNQGDEIILRGVGDGIVDVVVYGNGVFPNVVSCTELIPTGHSLERLPYWFDSDNCPVDFRDWPFPTPGRLPD